MKHKAPQQVETAELEVVSGHRAGERIRLVEASYVIGSDEAAQITCVDPDVEWSHARVYRDRDRYWVEDLQSRGGVFVNDKRTLHRSLSAGDTIGIGAARFRFVWPQGAAASARPADGGGSDSVAKFVAQVVHEVAPGLPPADGADGAGGRVSAQDAAVREAAAEVIAALRANGGDGAGAPSLERQDAGTAEADAAHAREAQALEVAFEAPAAASATARAVSDAGEPAAEGALTAAPEASAPTEPAAPAAVAASETEERLRAECEDLRCRCAALEQELKRKREGLSLATESFVEQLERAKERIASFARRHAETEATVRAKDEELARLRADYAELEARSAAQIKDLIDKLDTARREFDEVSKIAAHKGNNLARLVAEAKAGVPRIAALPLAALTASSAAVETAAAGSEARRSTSSIRVLTATELRRAPDGSRDGASKTAAAIAAVPADAPPPAATIRVALGSNITRYAAAFLVIAGAVFALVWLAGKGFEEPPPRATQSGRAPEKPPPARKPSTASSAAAAKPPAPAPAPARPPVREAAKPQIPAPQPPVPAAAKVEEPAAADESDLLAALRAAHRARDEAKIAQEEKALIDQGKDILPQITDAYQKERQFNVRVSLQYVMFALEGKDGARDIVDAMRAAKDPGEKMRLAFMLQKLNRPEDVPFYEDALAAEQDPMIKKYLVKALGKAEGARGLDVLRPIAQSSTDRSLRMEALRAIEEKKTPEAAAFLMELAGSEQDAAIKTIAVRAVANTSGREASGFFQKVLEQDERTNNRAEAAKYYARVGDPSDIPLLEQLHARERVYYIRQKIRQAIESIQRRAGIEPTTVAAEPPPPGGEMPLEEPPQ